MIACDNQNGQSQTQTQPAGSTHETLTVHSGIAVLGWGSLIWDPRTLAASAFKENGPVLPIQFSRLSNNKRVTLVKDLDFGVPVKTWYAVSNKTTVTDAAEDLRIREDTPLKSNIGYVDFENNTFSIMQIKQNGKSQRRDQEQIIGKITQISENAEEVKITADANIRKELITGDAYLKNIIAWAKRHGFNKGVIWTDLSSNWYEKTHEDWSIARTNAYLKTLEGEEKRVAVEYIEKTPQNVKDALNARELLR